MAVRSRETLRRLPLLLDCDPVYTRTGWLFLVDEETRARDRERRDAGGRGPRHGRRRDLQEFSRASTRRASPTRSTSRTPGFADPVATTQAYVEAGRRRRPRGEGTPVEAVELEGERVRGVRVGGELIECDNLVLAAGPVVAEARR